LGISTSWASYKSDIYKAYISSDMIEWKKILDEMGRQTDKNNEFILELINYQYGYIAWNLGNKKSKPAEECLDQAYKNLEILEKNGFRPSDVNSYKSAFYGFKIALNKFQAPFLGSKSTDCAKLAMKLDTTNPYGYIQMGNTLYYAPALFGGSKNQAIGYFQKALNLMEKDASNLEEDWNYLNLLTQLALSYQEIKYYQTAKIYFDKILRIEPDFKWVKEDLYPAFLKKMK